MTGSCAGSPPERSAAVCQHLREESPGFGQLLDRRRLLQFHRKHTLVSRPGEIGEQAGPIHQAGAKCAMLPPVRRAYVVQVEVEQFSA